MSKKSKRKSKKRQSQLQPQTEKKGPFHRIVQFLKYIFGVLSAIGLVYGIYAAYPFLTIDVGRPITENDPLSVPFLVKNEGLTTIYDIEAACIYSDIIMTDGEKVSANRVQLNINMLSPHDSKAILCFRGFAYPGHVIERGRIIVSLQFKILGIYKTSKTKSFTAFPSFDRKNTTWEPT